MAEFVGELHRRIQGATGRTARQSKPLKVRYGGKEIEIQAKAGQTYNLGPERFVQ